MRVTNWTFFYMLVFNWDCNSSVEVPRNPLRLTVLKIPTNPVRDELSIWTWSKTTWHQTTVNIWPGTNILLRTSALSWRRAPTLWHCRPRDQRHPAEGNCSLLLLHIWSRYPSLNLAGPDEAINSLFSPGLGISLTASESGKRCECWSLTACFSCSVLPP